MADGNVVVAAAEIGNATSHPGEPQRILDDVSDRMQADAITCSEHGCTAACNVQQTLAKERTITNVSDGKANAAARQAASFEFSPQIVRIFFGEVADGKFRCACGGRRERHLPSCQARARMVGGGCSHLHAAQGARRHGHQISVDPVQRRR